MLVWGGSAGAVVSGGGRYNPSTNTWASITNTNAPSGRNGHTAVWTGGLMVVWGGGVYVSPHFSTGGRYDPATNSWTPTHHSAPPAGVSCTAPSGREAR